MVDKIEQLRRDAARKRQTALLAARQLPLWPETLRSLPNEIVRSALFVAANRKKPREFLKQREIAVIGDGRISYTGEELRQDDETVWLQLVHLARERPVGDVIHFSPRSFCKAVGWPINGQSYQRLRLVLTRLQATALTVYSNRLAEGVSLSMVPSFRWRDEHTESNLKNWQVRIAPELVILFSDLQYTRLEWEQRLSLPVGLATWLHGYFASHAKPYPIKLETIRKGSGLSDETPDDFKKTVSRALDSLIQVGFLQSYTIGGPDGTLVTVERTPRPNDPPLSHPPGFDDLDGRDL